LLSQHQGNINATSRQHQGNIKATSRQHQGNINAGFHNAVRGETTMFKNILIPTDGSKIATKAVKAGIEFAAAVGAKVVVYQALEETIRYAYSEGYMLPKSMTNNLERQTKELAEKNLAAIKKTAVAAGVACETVSAKAIIPYAGIVATAKKKKCDAIFMASHGRRGIAGLLMGSVTNQVLTHSKIPVVVYR
jgi:nucleotide-binding universal stress UspA family protein